MQIKFIGAAGTVTGSKHLLTTTMGKQILLDCGLYQQGKGADNDERNRHLGLNPLEVEAVILSHAHIDHSGNLPLLVKQGFLGKIYCTPATYDLCEILLSDSAHIHENEISYVNKRRATKGKEPLKPLYTIRDAEKCLKHFKVIPYKTEFILNDEVSFSFTDAGHILGSAVVNLKLTDDKKITHLCFTGDIGRSNDLLLKDPDTFPQADYIICESTYGNRLHKTTEDAQAKLLKIVTETCVIKKGKLIIPAFSVGRTQELVYTLNVMSNKGLLPKIKIYVDSPLSVNATNIMRKHPECFNKNILEAMKTDSDPFGFNELVYVQNLDESKSLNDLNEPCIIISASGMMEAGRVKHHIKNNISNEKNTLLVVGYCPPGTLGDKLLNGAKKVKIYGIEYDVKATIETIQSYSAHGDYKEMIKFLSCQDKTKVKKIFLVHGEAESQNFFKEQLILEGYSTIEIPNEGESVEIN